MKKVFNGNSQIAHLFANKLQDEARNSAYNFYFNRGVIYSYGSHFPIAKHATNKEGEKALLFTLRRYSNTTSKHISIVRQSTSHLNKIYCANPENTHEENFKYWVRIAESEATNLTTARKPEKYLNILANIQKDVEIYSNFFGLQIPAELIEVLSIQNKESFLGYKEKKEQLRIEQEKKQKAEKIKEHKKALAKWLNFEIYSLYSKIDFDYLRYDKDSQIVQTSQGVKLSLTEAQNLYKAIESNSLKVGQKVLQGFEVLHIDKKTIKIGCHDFKTSYLLNFGKGLF